MQTSNEKKNHSSLHKSSTSLSKLLEMDRKFNVPVEQLYQAFITPESLKTWWWPNGLYSDYIEMDFREGGKYFINMKGYDQGGGGMTGHFEEIIENHYIVMTDHFADKNGNQISANEAKMAGTWPTVTYITFNFYSFDKNSSHLTLSQQGIPNEAHSDCIQGWSESFDKLEKYLSEHNKPQ